MGALRVVRWSAHYDQTVLFYRDIVGLPVLETFRDSYGLDGTLLGLPGGAVHLEIVRLTDPRHPQPGLDQLVFYLPDAAVGVPVVNLRNRVQARSGQPGRDALPGGGVGQVEHQLIEPGLRVARVGQTDDLQVNRAAARERITARLAAAGLDPVAQIDYWEANGGVTYQDPDGREVVFASWIYRPPT